MAAPPIRINRREFDDTFRKYMAVSQRDIAVALNTKAFYIARRATVETAKANAGDIRKVWGVRAGRSNSTRAAFAGKIINQIRGARGEKGLYGEEMAEAVAQMLVYRLRTVGFIKSGWIPAIKRLEPLAEKKGAPRQDRRAAQLGTAKGWAVPARPGIRCIAIIANTASTKRDIKQALLKFGTPGLQRAFDHEVASMKTYIERKMTASAKKLGIKTG